MTLFWSYTSPFSKWFLIGQWQVVQQASPQYKDHWGYGYAIWLIDLYMTLFRSITMCCGTESISRIFSMKLNVGIFHEKLSVPQNIVMDMNDVKYHDKNEPSVLHKRSGLIDWVLSLTCANPSTNILSLSCPSLGYFLPIEIVHVNRPFR